MKEAEILYEAFHSEHGIEVELIGNFQMSLQRIYTARRKDPDLEIIQIFRSPTSPTHIWLVKNPQNRSIQPPPSAGSQRPDVTSPKPVKQNPQGEGPLYSLADMLGDD